jgi:predicted chitinase
VILAQQENLDREVRVGQQRRESNEFVEHRYRCRPLRRLTGRRNLGVLVGRSLTPWPSTTAS